MARVKRALLIGIPLVAFIAVAFLVARWLNNDSVERAAVEELLEAQIAGDAPRMLRRLECADAACEAVVRANAKRLKARRRAEDRALPIADRARAALAHETDARRVVHRSRQHDRPVRARAANRGHPGRYLR